MFLLIVSQFADEVLGGGDASTNREGKKRSSSAPTSLRDEKQKAARMAVRKSERVQRKSNWYSETTFVFPVQKDEDEEEEEEDSDESYEDGEEKDGDK